MSINFCSFLRQELKVRIINMKPQYLWEQRAHLFLFFYFYFPVYLIASVFYHFDKEEGSLWYQQIFTRASGLLGELSNQIQARRKHIVSHDFVAEMVYVSAGISLGSYYHDLEAHSIETGQCPSAWISYNMMMVSSEYPSSPYHPKTWTRRSEYHYLFFNPCLKMLLNYCFYVENINAYECLYERKRQILTI